MNLIQRLMGHKPAVVTLKPAPTVDLTQLARDYDEKFAQARQQLASMGIHRQKPLIRVSPKRRLKINTSEVANKVSQTASA